MTWRSDLNRLQRATNRAQRTERDLYVLTGPNGTQRLAKRIVRREATRQAFRLLRKAGLR